MKSNKSLVLTMVFMIVVAALYRVVPGRPWGFAPQIALALFGGAVIRDKKWAFALPIFSMFLSDVLYQVLYKAGVTSIYGFYSGQLINYLLYALMVFVGFAIRRVNVLNVLAGAIAAPVIFFLLSNFSTWIGVAGPLRGLNRPFTFAGLMMAYSDGLPFLAGSLEGTLFFSALFFGGYYFYTKKTLAANAVHA